MSKTRIVTNAVCDLPLQAADELGVVLIPESIIFDGVSYLSNIDFTPSDIYKMLRENACFPTAAHPNVAMYMDALHQAARFEDCGDIVLINMTSRMSGSYNTANIAKSMLAADGFGHEIYLVDSLELTHGLAFLVLEAVKMADEGLRGSEIAQRLDLLKSKIGIYFVLPSLENARKGGRLGNIKSRIADSLNIKPVLMFRDGIETDVKVAYSFRQALRYLPDYYQKRAEKGRRVVIFHADNLDDANWVRGEVEKADPQAQVDIEWLGPGIGVYTGEGCVGITFWEP